MQSAGATSTLERVLRRDRAVTLIALVGVSALSWAYIMAGIGMDMEVMTMPDMAMPADWTPLYFALMLAMWTVMMTAMMLPSAAPMVLLFMTIERRRGAASPLARGLRFVAAYLLVWAAFSLGATILQWQLDRLALLTPMIATTSAGLAALVFIAAGLYQFTPVKQACLKGCRSPVEFLASHWRRGPFGMGLVHGLVCTGCCWMVMLLLFVGGAMNLAWVALLAAFVLAEKTMPHGRIVGFAAGLVFIASGAWMLYARLLA